VKFKLKVNFKTKILLYFTFSLILGFSIINIVSYLYIKNFIDRKLEKDIKIYKEIYYKKEINYLIPHLKLKSSVKKDDTVVGRINELYIVLDKSKLYEKLIHYLVVLILWEIFTMFVILLLANTLVEKTIKKENEIKEALEVFILAFTHKIKNFLGVQKVNIEILKINFNKKALLRIEKTYSLIEKDIETLVHILKSLRNFSSDITEINLKDIINKTVKELESIYPEKTALLFLQDIKIKGNLEDVKNITFIILENAFKYSEKRILIELFEEKKYSVFYVSNDINVSFSEGGTGVGLEIAKFLSKKYKWILENKINDNEYSITLKFPKR